MDPKSNPEEVKEAMKEYYGKKLTNSEDLQTDACTPLGKKFYKSACKAVREVHDDVIAKYYGCGNPIPEGLEGATVLDLGSGTGRDVYICSKLVGETGKVIGIDMTQEQIDVAKEYQEYHAEKFGFANTEFIQGYVEDYVDTGAIEEGSVDVIISNCVVNLCPDKEKVLRQAWKVLKEGGELYFSDMYCDRRLPEEIKQNKELWGEGLAGSLYVEDFKQIMRDIGFRDIRICSLRKIKIKGSYDLKANYYSITVRAFKISTLEERCEDYGNLATYNGKMTDFAEKFEFDKNYTFIKDEPLSICQNTAETLKKSRFSEFFTITEDEEHQGLHPKQSFQIIRDPQPSCSS
ncbi:unnamed protein product [Moneuplotes crassus]|uniref:Arsenite methyltransferase n=1 Tax=Euplotes crassus TaxID=5936 RepID=A0AAD1UUG1_EUPCR|nr:unnamed protein product [Moneuplotes crassus]